MISYTIGDISYAVGDGECVFIVLTGFIAFQGFMAKFIFPEVIILTHKGNYQLKNRKSVQLHCKHRAAHTSDVSTTDTLF